MKNKWWKTDNSHGILIIIVSILAGCLLWFKNDLCIYWSIIYMYFGTWFYHFTVENKNRDIEYLNHEINKIERYTKWLENQLNDVRGDDLNTSESEE